MRKIEKLRDMLRAGWILSVTIILCLLIQSRINLSPVSPLMFNLAVFLISRYTDGYMTGIISSIISVLAVNYAFTYPYFRFNFSILENLISVLVMLIVTIMTSTLTTQIKIQEQRRREMETEQMRANLLRAISHDLRTPLTSIYGSSETILSVSDDLDVQGLLNLIQGIRDDARWLIDMVENLLSVTRIEDGDIHLRLKDTPVEELSTVVIGRFRKKHPSQTVEVQLPDSFVSIPMDPILIEQVVTNLMENALIHAKGMTKVSFIIEEQTEDILFTVADDGCGVTDQQLHTLFLHMQETDRRPVDGKKRSMGIGLYVCAAIIKAHNGKIGASHNQPSGLMVSFSLPRRNTNE